jgi:hypothetical protein
MKCGGSFDFLTRVPEFSSLLAAFSVCYENNFASIRPRRTRRVGGGIGSAKSMTYRESREPVGGGIVCVSSGVMIHIGRRKHVSRTAFRMHKSDSTAKITLTVTTDVRAQLEHWAKQNLTSLSAEMNRAVRFRAQHGREGMAEDGC